MSRALRNRGGAPLEVIDYAYICVDPLSRRARCFHPAGRSSCAGARPDFCRFHVGHAGWVSRRSTDEGTHYSSLADINRTNVGQLGLAWEFDAFVVRGGVQWGAQSTPMVIDGIMYFTGPWGVCYAVDAQKTDWCGSDPRVKGGSLVMHAVMPCSISG